jgi:hypothetical protein
VIEGRNRAGEGRRSAGRPTTPVAEIRSSTRKNGRRPGSVRRRRKKIWHRVEESRRWVGAGRSRIADDGDRCSSCHRSSRPGGHRANFFTLRPGIAVLVLVVERNRGRESARRFGERRNQAGVGRRWVGERSRRLGECRYRARVGRRWKSFRCRSTSVDFESLGE